MAQLLDTALVHSEYNQVLPSVVGRMRPHISAPHAKLFRYSVAAEKTESALGAYDPLNENTYDWPSLPDEATADLAYDRLQLYMDEALLQYFADLTASDSTIIPVSGYSNRIRSSSVSFKTNGDYERSAALYERDVQVGDVAYVRGSVNGDSYDLTTYVRDFIGETIAATVDTAEAESANQAAQPAAVSVDKVSGPDNCIDIQVDASQYDGLEDGDIEETYLVEVVVGSTGGDYDTAILRVTSASGNDDVAAVSPQASGDFAVGTRGLKGGVTLTGGASCSSEAVVDGVSPTDLVPGQKWRFHVYQQYTPVTPTSSGAYTGDTDCTYIIEVTKGGIFADEPEITVTTDTGVDLSGPTVVSGADSAVAVGSKGVFISFSPGGLCKGDRFTISVTAETEGAMQTLVLGHNLPTALLSAVDLDLRLYIKKNGLAVARQRIEDAPTTNWSAASTGVTVASAITAYDSSWTDGGTMLPLPVKSGRLFMQYRAWLTDFTDSVGRLSDVTLVSAILGPVHYDNPLSLAVWLALRGSGGQPVLFSAVSDPTDLDAWTKVLNLVAFRDDVYKLAPMTHDTDVCALFAAHVAEQSSNKAGTYRSAYFSLTASETAAIVNSALSSNEEVVLATLADDPDTTGTQYTYLRVTSDNADLVDKGVRAGDVVRYLYTTDGFGGGSYTTFVVDEVVNEDTLKLRTGHGGAVPTPQKMEIWRTYTKDELVTQLSDAAEVYDSDGVVCVWPDRIDAASYTDLPGYFACALLAGLRCGTTPHRSLRDVVLPDVEGVDRTVDFFTARQIRALGEGRVTVITEDTDGNAHIPAFVTTGDPADYRLREESVRTTRDACRLFIFAEMRSFCSRNNVHPKALQNATTQLQVAIETLRSTGYTADLGAVLTEASFEPLRRHAVFPDQLVIVITATLPFPHSKDIDLSMFVPTA